MRRRVYCMSLDRRARKLQLDWRADALTQSNPTSPEASCSPLLTFCIIFNSPIIELRNNSSAAPHLRTPVSFYLVRQIKDEGGTCFGGSGGGFQIALCAPEQTQRDITCHWMAVKKLNNPRGCTVGDYEAAKLCWQLCCSESSARCVWHW